MRFFDTVQIAGPARITKDGYFVADALVGRANNIQEYSAAELGLTDRKPDETIRIFRPEAEVFAKDALASLAHRPVTIDHPSEEVTAENWRKLAVGDVGGEIARDGEFIRVPLKIMDAGAVDAVKTDHREFSLGYAADLDFTAGVHDGQAYDASMKTFRYNHLAAVKAARGGSELRIVDERPDDRRKPNAGAPVHSPQDQARKPNMHTLIIDGLQVTEVSDQAKAAIEKLQGQVTSVTSAKDSAEAKVAEHVTTISTKDAEIATLKQAVIDAKVTPAQLRDAAKAYDQLVADAKKLAPALAITDTMDEAAIKKAVVAAKLGDAAAAFTDAQFDVSFSTLVATSGSSGPVHDALRSAIASGPVNVADGASVRNTVRSMQYN
jgi:uncharacterized protein